MSEDTLPKGRPPLPKINNIFLIGYRGTGKTTVARLLADRLGWQYADADAVLEERLGRTIAQLFAEDGEAAFRDYETEVLDELCRGCQQVIASGGGVVLRDVNRERLRQSGRVVWLRAATATLWHRLQNDATSVTRRPVLTVGGLAEIEELLSRREPLYRATADMIIETDNRQPDEVAALILTQLQGELSVHGQPA